MILKNQKGWTLIELVLVIVLMAILAVSAIPKDDAMVPIELDAAARKIVADIRYAQDMATTTSEPYGFQVTGTTTYKIYNVNTGTVATSPYNQEPMNEDLSVFMKNIEFHLTTYQVEFDSNGSPTVGGGSSIIIELGNAYKTIEVSNTSGFIKIQ